MPQITDGQNNTLPAVQENFINIREILNTILRYKLGIICITGLSVLLSVVFAYSITPLYRATTTILIEQKAATPIKQMEEVYDPGYGTREYFGTQFKLLQSRSIAEKVIEKLDLTNHPEFQAQESEISRALSVLKSYLPFLPAETVDEISANPANRKNKVVKAFLNRVSVIPVYNTQLLEVNYEAKDPLLAAKVANTITSVYIQQGLDARLKMSELATSWLQEKLETLKIDLEKSEAALQEFRENEKLVNVGGSRGLVEQELIEQSRRSSEARRKKTELANSYNKIKNAGTDLDGLEDVSALLQDPLVRDAKSAVFKASQKVKSLESRYGPKHPSMMEAIANQKEASNAYRQQLIAAAQGIKAEYEIAVSNEQAVQQNEFRTREEIKNLDRKQHKLSVLEREVKTNKDLYDLFLTRLKETSTTQEFEFVNARVVDAAVIPGSPYKPKKKKIVLIWFFGSLFFSLVIVAFKELLIDVINSSSTVEEFSGSQVLGVLPEISNGFFALKSGASQSKKYKQLLEDTNSGFSEGMRGIRTSLLLSDGDEKKKVIVVSSCAPQEGKTTVSINLAIAFGKIEKVLLIDLDLRRPLIHKTLGLEDGHPGLVNCLAMGEKLHSCIQPLPEAGIDVLTTGGISQNPSEILSSKRFKEMMKALADHYDRIIVDTAPCEAVTDTFLLAPIADYFMLVVKAGQTKKRLLRHTSQQLEIANCPLKGVIVNYVDPAKGINDFDAYYYSYKYYGAT